MSAKHVEFLREMQARWNGGDWPPLAELFHPDVEFRPLRAATEGTYRGLRGMEAFRDDTVQVFELFETHYEYEDLGDRVLAWGTIRLRARGSGIETEIESGGLFEFRDDRIVRWEDFGSRERALAASRPR